VLICLLPLVWAIQSKRMRRCVLGVVVVFTMVGAITLSKSSTLQSKLRIDEGMADIQMMADGNYSSSIGARVSMWQAASQMFKEKPVFGFGQRAFSEEYKKRMDEGRVPRTQIFGQPHSDVFHAVSSGGVLKLCAYLGLLLAPWIFFYKHYKAARSQYADCLMPILGMKVVAAYFLFGLTNSILDLQIYSTTYAVLVCLLAKLTTCDKERAV
jgi:O-antigen ligase